MSVSNLIHYMYDFNNSNINQDSLNVWQDPSGSLSAGVGATVWDSALIAAKYLENVLEPSLFNPQHSLCAELLNRQDHTKRIVELGAGTGLLGLVMHRLLSILVSKQPTIHQQFEFLLTDKPCCMPLLQMNMESYSSKFNQDSTIPIHLETIDWNDWKGNIKADFVLLADCVHWPELFEPLCKTLERITKKESTVLLAYERRNFDTEAQFFAMFGKLFSFSFVPADCMDPIYQSPDDIYLFLGKRKSENCI